MNIFQCEGEMLLFFFYFSSRAHHLHRRQPFFLLNIDNPWSPVSCDDIFTADHILLPFAGIFKNDLQSDLLITFTDGGKKYPNGMISKKLLNFSNTLNQIVLEYRYHTLLNCFYSFPLILFFQHQHITGFGAKRRQKDLFTCLALQLMQLFPVYVSEE